ncbi:hypothetical protein [Herbiconiux sp. YIM B11900]|uniref:hypothetical protein n=1 Tax=Herbiconiux sp. YIM B11900 TaxID=3404131 RepID=UPI003F87D0B6
MRGSRAGLSAVDFIQGTMMHKKISWRQVLAVPVVATLALGGALLGAGAANAAEDTLVVTSPTPGQVLDSRTVVFAGTGSNGSTVNVLDEDGDRIPGTTAAVVSDGVWTTTGTYEETDEVEQTVYVNQVTGGSGAGEEEVSFVLPPAYGFAVLSPVEGETTVSRTVVFGGTGTDGATVNVLDDDGNRIPGTEAAVVTDGIWVTTGTYTEDDAIDQTVYVNQVIGGAGRGEQTVSFKLPEELLPAPVITAPTAGQALTGASVTFTGTGTPGKNVLLAVVPTSAVGQLSSMAQAVPADPEDPIVVDDNGDWTVTLALEPGDYTAAAALVTLGPDNTLESIISEPSIPVQFTLAAAAVPVTPVTPAGDGSTKLANTGAELGALGLGGVLAAAGLVLVLVRRKTRLS